VTRAPEHVHAVLGEQAIHARLHPRDVAARRRARAQSNVPGDVEWATAEWDHRRLGGVHDEAVGRVDLGKRLHRVVLGSADTLVRGWRAPCVYADSTGLILPTAEACDPLPGSRRFGLPAEKDQLQKASFEQQGDDQRAKPTSYGQRTQFVIGQTETGARTAEPRRCRGSLPSTHARHPSAGSGRRR
jgi:hypothetical protein